MSPSLDANIIRQLILFLKTHQLTNEIQTSKQKSVINGEIAYYNFGCLLNNLVTQCVKKKL